MKIAHISDIHCNHGTDFNEKIFDKAVKMVNKVDADIVFVSGDLTTEGLLSEYEFAKEKLKQIDEKLVIVPGNHDERNLGFKLFPEFFGETDFVHVYDDVNLVGLASSEPDKDDGRLGRGRHRLIEQGIKKNDNMTIIEDAGETLDILLKNKVPLALMGHRHVPFAVKIHKTLLVNAGTFSCNRTRARFGNTFNIIDIEDNSISITVVDIRKEKQKKTIDYNLLDGCCINRNYD